MITDTSITADNTNYLPSILHFCICKVEYKLLWEEKAIIEYAYAYPICSIVLIANIGSAICLTVIPKEPNEFWILLNSSKVIFSEKLGFFVGKKLFFVVNCNLYQLNNVKVEWNKSYIFSYDWLDVYCILISSRGVL